MNEEITYTEPKRAFSSRELILLPLALIVGLAFDRLVLGNILPDAAALVTWGIFWLVYIVLFSVFYQERLRKNPLGVYIGVCAAFLSVWGLIFDPDANYQYAIITFLVIPAVLMAQAAVVAGGYGFRDAGKIARAWFPGWFIRPFSGLGVFGGAIGYLAKSQERSTFKKICLGILISLPLLLVIIPLLSGADRVFGYYVARIFENWNVFSLIGHSIIVMIAFALFYSFLWNVGYGGKWASEKESAFKVDPIISLVVVGIIAVIYALFCAVLFTYLFARAGLPAGLTYSEYAREGFSQTVTVCALNLTIFGFFTRFGLDASFGEKWRKTIKGLLFALLSLTGVMLLSGAIRLTLYIQAYGLTWLRLLSAWFIIYLVAVIVICAVRLLREKTAVAVLCAAILLAWFLVLGYANPSGIVELFNGHFGYELPQWRGMIW